MSKITNKAEGIIKRRRELVKRLECLQRMLDVFDSSDDMNLLIWQVSLVKMEIEAFPLCYVAFGTEKDSIHFNRKNLLTDEYINKYIKLEESHPIILAMKEVDEIATKEMMKDIYDYLVEKPLKNFSVEYEDGRLTLKMNKEAICENKEPEK